MSHDSTSAGEQAVEKRVKAGGLGCLVLVVLVIGAGVWLFSGMGADAEFTDDDSDLYSASQHYGGTAIPNFSDRDAQRLSNALGELESTYGVCFGWSLTDGVTGEVDYGSSRGPGVRATSCGRWAEVRVAVGYTSANSPNYDAADISVAASGDFPQASGITRTEFAELGIDADALIQDPVSATGHGALALPLLLIQEGALKPADGQPQRTGPGDQARSLPDSGGSDFPIGTVALLAVLGLGAVAAIVIGIRTARRQ